MAKHIISSMTGYGRGSASSDDFRVSVDMRSVNGRFLEIRAKIPRFIASVENKVRETISKQIHRGMVDLSVNIQSLTEGFGAHIDHGVAKVFAKEIQKISPIWICLLD